MAKALELTEMTAPPIPRAAQLTPTTASGTTGKEREAGVKKEPLQVRWPAEEVKAAKIASLQLGFSTVSDFMLTCFRAYMQSQKDQGKA